ncbi:UNVERIFIED_CONTAM: hypothetical protein Slati_0493200 [Sesamum latifolium]|uniref:Uncharacterized protein n=1 Tax=Sesamum latifolium TaxID=2727402 RepID=A0AAW2XYB0_9LAMI
MSTRSLMTSRRRWPRWHFPLWGMGLMLAKSNSWLIDLRLLVRSFPSWTCKLLMPMLQTPSPILLSSRRRILLKTLPSWGGRGRSETFPPPPAPAAATDSIEGGAPSEGKPEGKKEKAPADPSEGPSNDLPASAVVLEGTPPSSSGLKDPKDTVIIFHRDILSLYAMDEKNVDMGPLRINLRAALRPFVCLWKPV